MPFEEGNQAAKGRRNPKPFAEALRMELLAAGDDNKALRLVARKLIETASEGKLDAIKELADRVDGKVAQAIIGGEEDDNPVSIVTRIRLLGPDDK